MIGKTNAQTSAGGGIKGEKVNISLKTNQSSHEDLKDAIITVSYATVVEEYTWNGYTITVEIPPYVDYSVGVSNVEGYASPSSYSSTSIPENAKSVELEYRTTIVKAVVKSNQSDTSDLANATLTVNGVALKNGQTTKIATGSTVTASWSDVTDYKKPSSASVTLSGASQNIEGTYQTEIVSVTLSADDGSSVKGASATINGKSYTWNGTAITQKIAFGTSYTIGVGEVSGMSTPSSQSFTANQASRSVSFVYVASVLKLSILSNQSGDTTISSVKSTVTYGSTSVEVGNGETIGIPTDKEVTITFPSVEGYKKPSAITFTNSNGGVAEKSGTYYTEVLTVNVSADDGGSVNGQKVTVVGLKKNVDDGVYIQDTNGNLWVESSWDGSAQPNGIAVISGELQFVIALQDAHNTFSKWYNGVSLTAVSNVMATDSAETAKTDYEGKNNTNEILSQLKDGAYAAEYCKAFVFPNGSTGYLGSAGEWWLALENKAQIDSVLSKCGGDSLLDWYYTSTQVDKSYVWKMEWDDGVLSTISRTANAYTRAFQPLSTSSVVVGGKATFNIPYDTEYTVSVDDKTNYTTPSLQSYTAEQARRTVSMVYEAIKDETLTVNVSASDGSSVDGQVVTVKQQGIANGVYIEDINGKLWTEAEWNGSVTPNGVAVITDECSFVIALQEGTTFWSGSSEVIPDVNTETDSGNAIKDYNGIANTASIVNYLNATDGRAAHYCNRFTFPNGRKGYLGAAGEWQAALDNVGAINLVLRACGGTSMSSKYWTSTQGDSFTSWYADWKSYDLALYAKTESYYVRSFAPLCSKPVSGGKATFTIPSGTTYEVSVNDKEGYVTPASQTYTAAGGNRTVSMQYIYHAGIKNPTNGVWIQDTDGYCHTTDAWDGTYTADCVAVITSSYRFGIALTEASSTMQIHNNYNEALENYMTAISDETQAKADYDGATNTTNIMKLQSGTGYAAGWCNAFSFPSGKKGFLPSLGQMWAAYSNRAAVDAALTKAGGTAFTPTYYWTSTFWGVGSYVYRYCWLLYWSVGTVNYNRLTNSYRVRAFSAL